MIWIRLPRLATAKPRVPQPHHDEISYVRLHLIGILLGALVPLAAAYSANLDTSKRIAVSVTTDSIDITVPVSNLILKCPRASFVLDNSHHSGAASSPRYFKLEDKSTGAVLSGWFESAVGAGDLKKSWVAEMAELKRKGFGEPMAVEEGQVGQWRTITYGIETPSGSSTHIRASVVQSGTWIDIHLSVSSEAPAEETRGIVTDLLSSLTVQAK